MTACICGVLPDFCGEHQPDNGSLCMDCSAFTRERCFDAAPLAATGFRDRDLCIACNANPLNTEGENASNAPAFVGA